MKNRFPSIMRIIRNKNILNFSSGCLSGFTSMMITYPLETTRTYLSLQTNKNKYKGIFDALRKIPTKQLYQGCKMSMYGFGGFSGIQYTAYYYINRVKKTQKLIANYLLEHLLELLLFL